ncbi:MAG: ComF family protein [Rickettsiales bacterium]|nr:ComF family protein [Rickettsiales bacterium]
MKNFLKKITEIVFPNQCLYCNCLIGQEGLFCNSCWQKLQFITDPKCNICSHAFEFQVGDCLTCAKCLARKPAYDKVITVFRYNQIIKKIIGDFKYRDNISLAKKLTKIIFNKFSEELDEIDFIIAVPLHKKRLRKRKFNQAIILAKELAKLTDKRLYYDLLQRIKNTTPQASLSRKEREKNLNGAFILKDKYHELVKGKNILLVDDVMTTGSTLENCAKILKKYKAKKVIVLTIAKRVWG